MVEIATSATEKLPVRFHHFWWHLYAPRGGGRLDRLTTLAVLRVSRLSSVVGFAHCSSGDVPNRALGRRIAEGRARAYDSGKTEICHAVEVPTLSLKARIVKLRKLEEQYRISPREIEAVFECSWPHSVI